MNTWNMNLSKTYTTVTPISRIVALVVFALLPIVAFFFGMSYQRMVDGTQPIMELPLVQKMQKACTMEAMLCPDGTAVGRIGPNCEFASCPTTSPSALSPSTTQGYYNSDEFVCPKEEWINCMPGFGPADSRCEVEFLQWAQKSCAGFKGGAY